MPSVRLIEADLPEFGVPETRPEISRELHAERLARLFDRAERAGVATLVVYADREHFANIAYLMEFEPRFEEALLILSRHRKPVVFTGPENTSRAGAAKLDADVITYPPFGLLGQDRTGTPAFRLDFIWSCDSGGIASIRAAMRSSCARSRAL